MFSEYYKLTKPGIIYGNLITATAGFFMATKGNPGSSTFFLYISTILGIALVIGSACAFNNVIDKKIDSYMNRTKKRAMVTGSIPRKHALLFATVLGIAGFLILIAWTNLLVVILGLIAYVDYIVFYGYTKRHSIHGTIVGSISGAMPIVAGYCAVTDRFDLAALALFLILVFWQMPHFYSIAMFRKADYRAAKLPVMPVIRSPKTTKVYIFSYIIAYIFATSWIWFLGYGNYIYLFLAAGSGLAWLTLAAKGFKAKDNVAWARKMFGASLLIILLLSLILSVGSLLP